MIKVLLADDHSVVRAGYRHLLQSAADIQIIAEADSGEEAYRLYGEAKPDVTVMDISMPGMGGLEALRRIRAQDPNARVLIFTMHDDAVFPARALEAGARGYLSKSCPPEALVEAVRAIAAGRKYLGQDVAQKVALQMVLGTGDLLQKLSAREFEVFNLLAQGLPLIELGERLHMDYKTVVNVQSRIRQKLAVENTAQLVMLAIRAGVIKP
ncbi:MAG: response regulator transcription factor [Methylotenera sp.]|nr:response regulator transcription factor [Methylotenera sp.]